MPNTEPGKWKLLWSGRRGRRKERRRRKERGRKEGEEREAHVMESRDSGARLPGFIPWLHHFPFTLCKLGSLAEPWFSHLCSRYYSGIHF